MHSCCYCQRTEKREQRKENREQRTEKNIEEQNRIENRDNRLKHTKRLIDPKAGNTKFAKGIPQLFVLSLRQDPSMKQYLH
jgi:wyosine [tRNA(Phe)-imidazoG37] synthetase (radical SAM superfamily)